MFYKLGYLISIFIALLTFTSAGKSPVLLAVCDAVNNELVVSKPNIFQISNFLFPVGILNYIAALEDTETIPLLLLQVRVVAASLSTIAAIKVYISLRVYTPSCNTVLYVVFPTVKSIS